MLKNTVVLDLLASIAMGGIFFAFLLLIGIEAKMLVAIPVGFACVYFLAQTTRRGRAANATPEDLERTHIKH